MADPAFTQWLQQIAQLEGLNPSNKETGQNIDATSKTKYAQQFYSQGWTPQQVKDKFYTGSGMDPNSQAVKYSTDLNALNSPGGDVNQGMYGDNGQLNSSWVSTHPELAASIQAGTYTKNDQGVWSSAKPPDGYKGEAPKGYTGEDFWSGHDYNIKDPNQKVYDPQLGSMITANSNIKVSPGEKYFEMAYNTLPMLMMGPIMAPLFAELGLAGSTLFKGVGGALTGNNPFSALIGGGGAKSGNSQQGGGGSSIPPQLLALFKLISGGK